MSEITQTSSDELNYKQAYLHLFHRLTEGIAWLKEMQREAESICVDEIDGIIPDSTGTA